LRREDREVLTTFSVGVIFKVVRVRRAVPVVRTGKVVVPVDVDLVGTTRVDVAIERTERTLTTFSVDTTLRIVRVRRAVPVVRTGKVVVPVNVNVHNTGQEASF
jgi:hypothetical protein